MENLSINGGYSLQCNILESNDFPRGLLSCDVRDIHDLLGGPTLIHLKGSSSKPLYLCSMLHGNETTSFYVIQRILKDFTEKKLSRDIIIFFGNTKAASMGIRQIPGQMDYNRIWEEGELAENKMALQIKNHLKKFDLFASIDIHNNTGNNPFYSCVNILKPETLALASQFGEHTVYFTKPHNVQSMYFSKFCTSVTIEAGLPGELEGIDEVYNYIQKILSIDDLKEIDYSERENVYYSLARINISSDAVINFDESELKCDEDFSFLKNLDDQNFEVIRNNTFLGYAKNLEKIQILNDKNENLVHDFFEIQEGRLITKRTFIPSMLSKNIEIVKTDCLGYVMEIKLPLS